MNSYIWSMMSYYIDCLTRQFYYAKPQAIEEFSAAEDPLKYFTHDWMYFELEGSYYSISLDWRQHDRAKEILNFRFFF